MREGLALLLAGALNWLYGTPRVRVERVIEYHQTDEGQTLRAELLIRPDGYGRIMELEFIEG